MTRKHKRMVRLVAIVLAVLLGLGTIVAAVVSVASAEESSGRTRNQYDLTMEYLDEEQALRVSQRLVYTNESSAHMDRVIFYAPANLFRRESALMYESDALDALFPAGYTPGGIELDSVCVNGAETDWGFQGENESYLRVACDLAPGESCEFQFEYYLLLTDNCAFLGVYETGWRLSWFYFAPAVWNDAYEEFVLKTPLSFTRYVYTPAADFNISLTLPDVCLLAATGSETAGEADDAHRRCWTIQAENVREMSVCFGRRYREESLTTASGVEIRTLLCVRGASTSLLRLAEAAIESYEEKFGAFPLKQIDLVQTDYPLDFYNTEGVIWLSEALVRQPDGDSLKHALRFSLAQQYFGMAACTEPSSDAWLSDSLCEYLSYLLLEEADGHEAYLNALNRQVVPSLQLTIPGGLIITSDAKLFTSDEYQIIVLDRGAAVFHELRTSMKLETMLEGLRLFYEKGRSSGDVLTEMDLVSCLDQASGGSWESFLTDWVFNIGDYVDQTIDWFD